MLQIAGNAEIIRRLLKALVTYEQSNPDIVIYVETPFIVNGSERTPAMIIYRKAPLADYQRRTPDWKAKPLAIAPDICVEVSDDNLDDKAAGYLKDGADLILAINPTQKTVGIHINGMNFKLSEADTLNGGEGLPGFSFPVRDLFA